MDAKIQSNTLFMEETNKRLSYLTQFGILLGLIGGGLILAAIVQMGFALSMMSLQDLLNSNSKTLLTVMAKPENINTVRLMQMFGTLVMLFIPALIFAKIVSKKSFTYLGLKSPIHYSQIFLVAAIAIAAMFLSGGLGELNKIIPIPKNWELIFMKMEDDYAEQVMIIGNMKNFSDYIISLIMIAILPAIFEELFFRGALQNLLINWLKNPHVAILVTSFLFSIIHFSYYGFLPRMALGLILGYIFYYSKNIWLSILAHFINNGIAITAMYYATSKGQSAKEIMNESYPIWMGVVALIIVMYFMIRYKKVCEKLISKFEDLKM